ncbi:homoserine kinase [Companilactobacillus kimchiensis]|uniref:Homoserine kinase n=1 Tax=Companilactobacillus kimchiensis TaxID=993692 RepID=A0A0R2LJV5_9LACO|nr:homoserine kinase [Companilactobacillus kimchiensis]KRN98420.1 homoserine kinase [Companilactobacillus kimchiensis]
MIEIKVPATSANIGVGFDCLGLAVSLYSTVLFEPSDKKLTISGCPEGFQNSHNLIYQSFVAACNFLQRPIPKIKITIQNNIPISRGLGSSAFCIVAGLAGANAWFGQPLSKTQLLELATKVEGHPDNVAPAIFGKMMASFIDDDHNVQTVPFELANNLHFIAIIPNYTVNTDQARKILPQEMTYQTATYQMGHAIALSKALEIGDFSLIKTAIVDKMHEPYRSQLIPDYHRVKQICENNAAVMYISGSGSTMMAITSDELISQKSFKELKKDFPQWEVLQLEIDTTGVTCAIN